MGIQIGGVNYSLVFTFERHVGLNMQNHCVIGALIGRVMKLGRQLAQMQDSRIRFYPEFPQTRFQDSQYSWILLASLTKCQSKDSDIITVFVGFHMGLFENMVYSQ